MVAMYTYENPHPAVTTDIVVFTIRHEQLKVLLVKRAEDPYLGSWALPGGFVEIAESLDEAAQRELREETGVDGVYLEQLYTFGQPDRDPRERVITVAYYALIPSDRLQIRAATDAEAVGWFALDELPALAFDHQRILDMALQRLRAKLDYSTIAFQFMPAEFTLSELQAVYERILGEPIDKRNFRKRILALGAIEETGDERREGAHRPAKLYRAVEPNTVQIIK
jgi:8-oxo-dGTP diphosphatase